MCIVVVAVALVVVLVLGHVPPSRTEPGLDVDGI